MIPIQHLTVILFAGSSLIVRRGSEPALNNVGKTGKPNVFSFSQSQTEKTSRSYAAAKRWSAIASLDETKASRVIFKVFYAVLCYHPPTKKCTSCGKCFV